ncbi:conserved protein of unknown function [Citrobacter freundii]|uniref:Uncharacterized protein n=1 Tax=uncultured Citrobacter sp. TaxID=200446 RepID=A0A212ICH5_9ENTR|nr:conserved protein of unknown function [Citrobacter freundii]SBV64498.1 conserved hypothetical protein [uncultured Citrobacter sp.]
MPSACPPPACFRYNVMLQQVLKVKATYIATYVTCTAEPSNTDPRMFTVM